MVIGASAGGVQAALELAGALPCDFPAPLPPARIAVTLEAMPASGARRWFGVRADSLYVASIRPAAVLHPRVS